MRHWVCSARHIKGGKKSYENNWFSNRIWWLCIRVVAVDVIRLRVPKRGVFRRQAFVRTVRHLGLHLMNKTTIIPLHARPIEVKEPFTQLFRLELFHHTTMYRVFWQFSSTITAGAVKVKTKHHYLINCDIFAKSMAIFLADCMSTFPSSSHLRASRWRWCAAIWKYNQQLYNEKTTVLYYELTHLTIG